MRANDGGEVMTDLQLTITAYIQENGGRYHLADKIESEWLKTLSRTRNRLWTEREKLFVLKNYNIMSCKMIANRLDRSYGATKHQVQFMREKAIINYRKTKNNSLTFR